MLGTSCFYEPEPPLLTWILKNCDVNKDLEIDSMAQITFPDAQIKFFEKILRAYVKVVRNKVVYRLESSITPNQPISTALKDIRNDTDLTKDFSLKDGT